jgi:uncharacterized protein
MVRRGRISFGKRNVISLDLSELAIVVGVFMLAGIVKGVIGLGLPTIAMGLLGALMTPP